MEVIGPLIWSGSRTGGHDGSARPAKAGEHRSHAVALAGVLPEDTGAGGGPGREADSSRGLLGADMVGSSTSESPPCDFCCHPAGLGDSIKARPLFPTPPAAGQRVGDKPSTRSRTHLTAPTKGLTPPLVCTRFRVTRWATVGAEGRPSGILAEVDDLTAPSADREGIARVAVAGLTLMERLTAAEVHRFTAMIDTGVIGRVLDATDRFVAEIGLLASEFDRLTAASLAGHGGVGRLAIAGWTKRDDVAAQAHRLPALLPLAGNLEIQRNTRASGAVCGQIAAQIHRLATVPFAGHFY